MPDSSTSPSRAAKPEDDIGIAESPSAVSPEAPGAMFKTSPDAFKVLPHKLGRLTIVREQG